MKRGAVQRDYGPQGQAQVTVAKGTVRIRFSANNVVYEIPRANCPDYLTASGVYRVSLSEDTTSVVSVSPYNGDYLVKFVRFGSKNAVPVPRREQSPGRRRDGTMYPRDFLKFSATLEVTQGPLAGAPIVSPFLYRDRSNGFANDGEGELLIAGDSRDVQKLVSFLTAAGVFEMRLPFSDNVLPALQEAILRRGDEFKVTITDGWPTSYEAVPTAKRGKPATKSATAKGAKAPTTATKTRAKKDKIPF